MVEDRHHIYPRSRWKGKRNRPQFQETILIRRDMHEAFHKIFGNAKSIRECVLILTKYWFSPDVRRDVNIPTEVSGYYKRT